MWEIQSMKPIKDFSSSSWNEKNRIEKQIVATKFIPIGTQIMTCNPYASIPKDLKKYCGFCLQEKDLIHSLLRCTKCQKLYYCSRNCQRKDWIDHQYECISIQRIQPHHPSPTLLLILRILRKLLFKKDNENFIWNTLKDHLNDQSKDRKKSFMEMSYLIQSMLSEEERKVLKINEILLSFERVSCNGFSICNERNEEIGIGIYLSSPVYYFNHSCQPNAFAFFHQKKLIIQSIQSISIHQPIHICYIDPNQYQPLRQLQLKLSYCFQCQCLRCQNPQEIKKEEEMYQFYCLQDNTCKEIISYYSINHQSTIQIIHSCPIHQIISKDQILNKTFIDDFFHSLPSSYDQQVYQCLVKQLHDYQKQMTKKNLLLYHYYNQSKLFCLDHQAFEHALFFASLQLNYLYETIEKISISCNHVNIGLLEYEVAKLYLFFQESKQAQSHLHKAYQRLSSCYGDQSKIVQEILISLQHMH